MARGAAIELGPLAEDDAGALLPPDTGDAARHRLYAESGGNPFYLTELARAAQLDWEDDDVPAAVQAAMARRSSRHPRPVRAASTRRRGARRAVRTRPGRTDHRSERGRRARGARRDRAARPRAARREPGSWAFRHPIVGRAAYGAANPRAAPGDARPRGRRSWSARAPRRARGPITLSAPPRQATRTRSSCWRPPPAASRRALPPPPRNGSPRRSASSPRARSVNAGFGLADTAPPRRAVPPGGRRRDAPR